MTTSTKSGLSNDVAVIAALADGTAASPVSACSLWCLRLAYRRSSCRGRRGGADGPAGQTYEGKEKRHASACRQGSEERRRQGQRSRDAPGRGLETRGRGAGATD